MGKSTFFTGQPVLTQLLSLMDRNSIRSLARAGQHDRYYKHFDTFTHLVTMLYCALNKCTSSREVVSGMKACIINSNTLASVKPLVKALYVMPT